MRDEPGLSGEHRKDLDIINRSGEHLLDLIDDVLDVAKIEAGRVVVENSPFDLDALVRDAIKSMRARSREKNLELALDASSVVPRFVRSDAGKLRQVILNLVGNAVKYTEHGSVTVRLDAHDMQDSSHPLLTIEVSDTGVGIAPEDQAHIFDPFVQAGQSGSHKGTGLGLSISRHFVQLMGGTIHVKSTHGIGSLFRVEVPVERAAEAEVMAAKRARERVVGLAPGQPEYRILIVEDKRENWLLLQRMLQDIGFRVRVAEDGAHGVEMYFTWRPHFIWMDLRLPDMEGVEAARRIRTLQGGQDVKIVAITASVFTGQGENVLAAGLDDCVRKPYGPGEIFDCMARQLGVRYLYREAAPVFAAETAAALRPEALAALPEQLRNELAYALTALDIERVREVIGGISKRDAELGAVLLGRADKFAYTFILRALEACSSRTAEEIL
jgi:CheY-like chemotaxis protein/anti-sigma regulatory factor (Ser/Thr protein kinase)